MENTTLLSITYTDPTGAEYSDTLAVCELSIPKEWLNRITTVIELTEPQKVHNGEQAKAYLHNLNVVIA